MYKRLPVTTWMLLSSFSYALGWSPGTRHFKFVPIGSTDAGDENATDESDFHKRKSVCY